MTTRTTRTTGTVRTSTRRAALVAVTGVASLVLAACGSGDGGSGADHGSTASAAASATAGAHNVHDVSFAQRMIPHHQQALEMARLADGRASSARVKDLASRIEKAQDPEIRTMTGWLKSWGEQVPMAGMGHSGHTGMDGMDGMDGMMSEKEMAGLKAARGTQFDRKFLSLMVGHHQGAVKMAATERSEGAFGPAKRLAAGIVTAQNAEIKEMRQLLSGS